MAEKEIPLHSIPPNLRGLTAFGDKTTRAVLQLSPDYTPSFFEEREELDVDPLIDAFKHGKWSDEDASAVVYAFANTHSARKDLDINRLARWVRHHPNDSSQVKECLAIIPPPEIEIIRVLSRAGSQKVVFLATWRLTQEDVVVKKIIGSTDASERIIARELRAYPLNMVHPNIIATYVLKNSRNEAFLVERKLSDVLNDSWSSKGTHEAANLLFDVGKALRFLHEKQLVHGDVKPDNIGKNGDTYILLDFGICREATAYTAELTPTGSLRTRAPELLLDLTPKHPEKIDVWALGATVYNSLKGRFPLINHNESIPRVSHPNERNEFEKILRSRLENEWDQRVEFSGIAEPMAAILKRMLEKDPRHRISSKEVTEAARNDLSAFIRNDSVKGEGLTRFSPLDELDQIKNFLQISPNIKTLLPSARKKTIQERLTSLSNATGFGQKERDTIEELSALIS